MGIVMLSWFRRHQRFFLTTVTTVVIITFCFFGSYEAFSKTQQKPDKKIAESLSGQKIYEQELFQLMRFIDTDYMDAMAYESGHAANVLNDGIIRKDFIKSGLFPELYAALQKKYTSELMPSFQERVHRFKTYKLYEHPLKTFSVEKTWKQFAPQMLEDYRAFKEAKLEDTNRLVHSLANLYLGQSEFPPQMLQRILYWQQQHKDSQVDPRIYQTDFAVFSAKSFSDWFGRECTEYLAQIILQTADFAKSKGYSVSLQEAKANLYKTAYKNFSLLQKEQKSSLEEIMQIIKYQMNQMGLTEEDTISLWQKILLMRHVFHDIEKGIWVDSSLYKDFHDFIHKGVKLELFELPEHIKLESIQDLARLEAYLKAIYSSSNSRSLCQECQTIDEITKNTPELVKKNFYIQLATITLEDVLLDISFKEVWSWQLEDLNWEKLQDAFPKIAQSNASNKDERFRFLQGLDANVREKIDFFSKKAILADNKERLQRKLSEARSVEQSLSCTLEGSKEIFPGVTQHKNFVSLLDKAILLGAQEQEGDVNSNQKLSCYTEDEQNFYRIRVLERSPQSTVLTYQEALEEEVLDTIIQKSVGEALDENMHLRFIQKIYPQMQINKESIPKLLKYRFDQHMQHMLTKVQKKEALTDVDPLQQQWMPQRKELVVTKSQKNSFSDEDFLQKQTGEFSAVQHDLVNRPIFYHVLDTVTTHVDYVQDSMEKASSLIGQEAKKTFFQKLLDEIIEKDVLVKVSKKEDF